MPKSRSSHRPGRKKSPAEKRFSYRIVFRLQPPAYERLAARARERGKEPNDYARDRALGRIRPTQAQRRLAVECGEPLDEITRFIEFAHGLLPHLERQFDASSEVGNVVRQARRRFPDPLSHVTGLRTLIEQAVHP